MKFPGSHGFANQLLVCALVTIGGGGGAGLGAVWMHQQITQTAAANKTLERDLAGLRRRLDDLNAQVEFEVNPMVLEQRNAEWRIGLEPSPRTMVQRVPGDARLMLAAKRDAPLWLDPPPQFARYLRPEDR
jgi:hypothetical protein